MVLMHSPIVDGMFALFMAVIFPFFSPASAPWHMSFVAKQLQGLAGDLSPLGRQFFWGFKRALLKDMKSSIVQVLCDPSLKKCIAGYQLTRSWNNFVWNNFPGIIVLSYH